MASSMPGHMDDLGVLRLRTTTSAKTRLGRERECSHRYLQEPEREHLQDYVVQ